MSTESPRADVELTEAESEACSFCVVGNDPLCPLCGSDQ